MFVKKYRDEAAKYEITVIIIVLLNPKLIVPSTVDEVSTGIKKNMDIKYFYLSLKGLAGLENKVKKIAKLFEEQSQEFYRKKRNKLKKKQSFREKMPTSQLTLFKLSMKIGLLYGTVYNNVSSLEYFKLAYDSFASSLKGLLESFGVWEVKAVGDALEGKLIEHYFRLSQGAKAMKLFRDHYTLLKKKIDTLEAKEIYKEYKWRAEQFYRHAEFLKKHLHPNDDLKEKVNNWFSRLYFVSIFFSLK